MTISKFLNLSQDNTLGGENPSEVKAVSEKAIKEYVDNHSSEYIIGNGLQKLDNTLSIRQEDSVYSYNKFGNLVEENGILSNFDFTNYATIPATFNANSTWEIVVKAKMYTEELASLIGTPLGINFNGIAWLILSQRQFVCLSNTTASWNIANGVSGNLTVSSNTYYYFKLEFTGSAYNAYYSLNGEDWILDLTITTDTKITGSISTLSLGYNKYSTSEAQTLNGEVDLGGCSLKINDELVWQGADNEYHVAKATSTLYGLIKPDNTSITVNNGVISANVPSGAFMAEYEVTLFDDIKTAINDGSSVFLKVPNSTGGTVFIPLTRYNDNVIFFGGIIANAMYSIIKVTSANTWGKVADLESLVNTQANQGLTNTQQTNARANISAQETLVSGTNIKTINSQSLLGSGNIEIEGAVYTQGEGIVISEDNEISTNNIIWRQW